tara:strand:+ start:1219 stop:2292 length:1074 start_codon:yes stop_codon:yes gene_type:complete
MKKEQTYEAFSLDNTKLNVYSDMNKNLETNVDFIDCMDNNKKDCEQLKIPIDEDKRQLIEKEKILNVSKDKRNKAQLTYTECDNKLKSCQQNYNEIMKKSKELNKSYDTLQRNDKMITENKTNIKNLKNEIKKMEKQKEVAKLRSRNHVDWYRSIEKEINNKIKKIKSEINSLEQTNRQINNKNINIQTLFYNLNASISSLKELYNINNCELTKDCYSELNENDKIGSDFNSVEKEYKLIQNRLKELENQHKICMDPEKNKCSKKKNQYEDKFMDINNNIYYMKSELENFTNLEENIELNKELKDIQKENKVNKNNFRLFQNPSTDSSTLLEYEICKNIVITTIGSVMLYYFFFEFE